MHGNHATFTHMCCGRRSMNEQLRPSNDGIVGASSSTEFVIEFTDGVQTVKLNRPNKLNAFTSRGYRQLAAALRSAQSDPAVQVLVITGEGRAFCSGVDLDALTRTDVAGLVNPSLTSLIR